MLVVSKNNTKKSTVVAMKPNGKFFKNQNHNSQSNRNNQNIHRNNNQSQNLNRNQTSRQQPPPKQNDSGQFICYNCDKPNHMARKCRKKPSIAMQANLTE